MMIKLAQYIGLAALMFIWAMVDEFDDEPSDYSGPEYSAWRQEKAEEPIEIGAGEFARWLKDAEKRFPPPLQLPEYAPTRKGPARDQVRGPGLVPDGLEKR